MDPEVERLLRQAFPGEDARYFSLMSAGNSPGEPQPAGSCRHPSIVDNP
jgi:hypothetical protein